MACTKKKLNVIIDSGPTNSSWCWWCCHPYETERKYIPINYNEKKDVFSVYGSFCSWGCAKAFNQNKYMSPNEKHTLFTLMLKRVSGKYVKIYPALHWTSLIAFGGSLTITEFRNNDKNNENISGFYPDNLEYNCKSTNLLNIPNTLSISNTVNTVNTENNENNSNEVIKSSKHVKNDYVLKRTKPLKGQFNTLESTMGLVVEK
tara:strand:+ start:1142 stop:1753 length:612 start_codon:yes stop_codon:yes gene_type:complete